MDQARAVQRSQQPVEGLGRVERKESLAALLGCLLRIAKPSFRAELVRLVDALQEEQEGRAA